MLLAEAKRLVRDYGAWLNEGFDVELEGDYAVISTPFLDPHNDEIELYVGKEGDSLVLTDRGSTLSDLESSGLDVSTEKRRAHLQEILNGFGVANRGEELFVRTNEKDFPQRKHNLLQAMLAVHDLYLTAQTHVQQFFTEDVALFLKTNHVPFFRDFKLSGRSGFDHHFDFAFPTTKEKPQRILVAINALTRDRATSTAFAVSDVRLARGPETLQAFAWINDQESGVASDHLDALRNYEIITLRWSRRDEALIALQS
jgi:hypothetical protein